tara:strand:+ start:1956 stop:2381 length:426 start_codon:yes stop_codon:yes gene_type:complete
MKDAVFSEYEVDIHLQCPNCKKYFRIRNYEIPQDTPSYHNCLECSEGLAIQPFTISVLQDGKKEKSPPKATPAKKKKKPKKAVATKPDAPGSANSLMKQAVQIMKTYGFGYREAKKAVEKVYYAGMSLEELVKKALSEFEK